ncbi:MAG: hypothetical protein KBB39_17415 [Phycicoccus sp.]|nr:hypothetical protein [Phycicoccus sp.]
MTNTMKVRVTLTIDVDRDAWNSIYGNGDGAAEVRDDVRAYVLEQVQGSAAADEGGILNARIG